MLSKLSPFAISSLCKLDEEANKLYTILWLFIWSRGPFHKTAKQELRLKFFLKWKVYSYSVSQNLKLKSNKIQKLDPLRAM